MTTTSRLCRWTLACLLAVPALLALGGRAAADTHFNPDACLDLSRIDFWKDGRQYHWVEAAGPTTNGCPLWAAVPYP